MLRCTLFGPFSAQWHGKPIAFPTRSTVALLSYLLLERRTPQPREHIAALLWPDMPEDKGRRNLRQTLLRLRKVLPQSPNGQDPIHVDCDTLQWNAAYPADIDVARFEVVMRDLESVLRTPKTPTSHRALLLLQSIGEIYTGDLLWRLELVNDLYAEWLMPWRERYRRQALMAFARLAEYEAHVGRVHRMEMWARRQLALDPDYEIAHHQLMRALLAQREDAAALKHYRIYTEYLAEYGVQPSSALRECYQQQFSSPGGGAAPPLQIPHNLPPEMTPFYGRSKEIEDLLMRLATSDQRLITITGLGGIGKTRLALATVRHFVDAFPAISPRFPGGVWFVPLADVVAVDEEAITQAILQSCGQSARPGESAFAAVVRHLRGSPCLLILDNVEHLPDIPHVVLNLLQNVPDLKILATSRRPLGMQMEVVRHLDGLPIPSQWDEMETPSVALLLERVQWTNAGFQLTSDTMPHLTHICRMLDGWPLALELAAGWSNRLPIEEIAGTVAQHIDALRTAMPDLPSRHRSIEAVLNGSYALLTPPQQRILNGFAIFRGGATQDAVAKILGANAQDLAVLVQYALLKNQEDRYTVHELIRQFAQRNLERCDERASVERAHGEYYLSWLIEQKDDLFGPQPVPVVHRIRLERHNLDQAWCWAARHGRETLLAAATPLLVRFYQLTGLLQEGKALLEKTERMLAQTSLLYDVLLAQAQLSLRMGAYAEARRLLERLSTCDLSTPRQQAEHALLWGKWLQNHQPLLSICQPFYQRALALAQQIGHDEILAESCIQLETLTRYTGQYMPHIIEFARTVSDLWIKRMLFVFFGAVSIHARRYQDAVGYWQQALRMSLDLEDEYAAAVLYNNLGDALREQEKFAAAEEAFRRATHLAKKIHYSSLERSALEGWARLLILQGNHQQAILLAQKAVRSATQDGDEWVSLLALACLGHAYAGLRQWGPAQNAYQQVADRLADFPQVAAEGLAGLAYVSWEQGNKAAACDFAERLLNLVERVDLEGFASPGLNYERVAVILQAMGRSKDAGQVRGRIRSHAAQDTDIFSFLGSTSPSNGASHLAYSPSG